MSVIHQIPDYRMCTAWSYAVRIAFWAYADNLALLGYRPETAQTMAMRITHGGLFSRVRPEQPERWIA